MMDAVEHNRRARRESQRRLQRAFSTSFVFVAVLWWVQIIQMVSGRSFARLGVQPRHVFGLVGVVLEPLIHASWAHLLANTPPVLILGTALLYGYPRASRFVVPVVWLGTGLGVWFTGRPAFHIGASGLAMGFIAFLLVAGLLRRDRTSVAITAAVAFLYGSALIGIVPGANPHISYASHAWGAGLGLLCALVFFRLDPPSPRRHYHWETEPEDAEDPLIGDLWRYPPPVAPDGRDHPQPRDRDGGHGSNGGCGTRESASRLH